MNVDSPLSKVTTSTVLFSTEDFTVVHTPGFRDDLVVVTFTPAQHSDIDPPIGFAQIFFQKRGISTICFVSHWDHWWQVDGILDGLGAAAILVGHFKRVITYGVSMGGFAALNFSGKLRATDVLAFCPQFSIDDAKVPFEKRWRKHAAKLQFRHDQMSEGISKSAAVVIVYDPRSADARHVALIHATNAIYVRTPFVGHNVADFLSRTGALKKLVLGFINGEANFQDHALVAAARRRESPSYWNVLADIAISSGRLALAGRLLGRMHDIGEPNYGSARKLGRIFERQKDDDNAGIWYASAATLRPLDPIAMRLAAACLRAAAASHFRAKRYQMALQRLELGLSVVPDDLQLQKLRVRVLKQL